MPAPQNQLLITQAEQDISVRLEPAYNAIQSLKLLYRHADFSAVVPLRPTPTRDVYDNEMMSLQVPKVAI